MGAFILVLLAIGNEIAILKCRLHVLALTSTAYSSDIYEPLVIKLSTSAVLVMVSALTVFAYYGGNAKMY
jgi:hypothetical protein